MPRPIKPKVQCTDCRTARVKLAECETCNYLLCRDCQEKHNRVLKVNSNLALRKTGKPMHRSCIKLRAQFAARPTCSICPADAIGAVPGGLRYCARHQPRHSFKQCVECRYPIRDLESPLCEDCR